MITDFLQVNINKKEFENGYIKQLEQKIKEQQKEIEELQKYMKTNLIPKSTINLLYINKDKIREKIEELEKTKQEEEKNKNEFGTQTTMWAIADWGIEILQELLEE